jgi:hypothetical protein
MNNTTLQLHVWLEIKWHHFQLASVLFRFELQQVILAVVYVHGITYAILCDWCVYTASMCYTNLFHQPMIAV